MRRISKALAAGGAGLALLFATAVPGAATPGTVNSGTLSVNLTPALVVDLGSGGGGGGGGGNPCSGSGILSLDVVTSGGTSPHGATTTLSINNAAFSYSSGIYFLRGITATASGSVNTGAGTVSTGSFSSTIGNIYPDDGTCNPNLSSPLCAGVRLATVGAVLSLAGSFSGTVTAPAIAGNAVVSGSGGIQASGCVAPFAALNGKTLTLNALDVTF